MDKNFSDFVKEFENNLINYSFKKYKLFENQIVYDIENSAIISVLGKTEAFNRLHIIVEEIFNDQTQNIKLKKFCEKYYKAWVSFFPFYNELGTENPFKGKSEYIPINMLLPELKIDERFKKWKGYKACYAIFELIDGEKKGYAVAKTSDKGSIATLRKIGEDLTNAYISSKEQVQENSEYVCGNHDYLFIIDKNMCEILEKRYFTKFKLPILSQGFSIPDLKGSWNYGYYKSENVIPYEELSKLKEKRFQEPHAFSDLYTEKMQKSMPSIDTLNNDYIYAEVEYVDLPEEPMWRNYYYYLCDDPNIKKGDKVLISRVGKETVGLVNDVSHYKGYEVPYPVAKTRTIIKKIETKEELEKYGFTEDDFSFYEDFDDYDDYDDFDDDEFETYYEYYIITTVSDNKETLQNIAKKLLENNLIASSQISEETSYFWWEGKVQNKKEYKLEVKTRDDKLIFITEFIKINHNYITPEIVATKIDYMTPEMKKRFDEAIDNKD